MRSVVLCAIVGAAVSGCTVYPAPYYRPTVAYSAPYAASEYYYYGPGGNVYYVQPHPMYGYVYAGGPSVTIGAPVPIGFHGSIHFGGRGGRRHW